MPPPSAFLRAKHVAVWTGFLTLIGVAALTAGIWVVYYLTIRNYVWQKGESFSAGLWWAPWLSTALIVALLAGTWLHHSVLGVRSARLDDEKARNERKPRREETRQFAEWLENQYSWVLEMPDDESRLRALQWYEQIVTEWKKENADYEKLRRHDDRDVILYELGEQGQRMLRIWARRRALYQWAYAYSTPEMRGEEILRLGRAKRQQQAQEIKETQDFKERMKSTGDQEQA